MGSIGSLIGNRTISQIKSGDGIGGKVTSGGEFTPSDFNLYLVSDTPYGVKTIKNIMTGMELYSDMFNYQVWYGYIELLDEADNLSDYSEATLKHIVIEFNDIKTPFRVLRSERKVYGASGRTIYDFEIISLYGYDFLRERKVNPVNTMTDPSIQNMIKKAMEDNVGKNLDELVVSSQAKDFFEGYAPFNGDNTPSVSDTVGVCTIKQPRFQSVVEQIDFLQQYAVPAGHNDVTNTVNDFWTWQPTPQTFRCESLSGIVKDMPKCRLTYGGIPKDTVLSTDYRCDMFELIRSPSSDITNMSTKIIIDPTSRSTSVYKSNIGKLKNQTGTNMNKESLQNTPEDYQVNVSYSTGTNTDVNRNIDYMNDAGENINSFGLDSKRLEVRNDYFTSLNSFYANISINRNIWDLNCGDTIELTIYKNKGNNYSSREKDKRLSGIWLVTEKGIHMRTNRNFSVVYGIVKDSI